MRNDHLAFVALQAEQNAARAKDPIKRKKFETVALELWLLYFGRYGLGKK